ncbi:MAG: hypothetical protein GC136_11400 [Alphaproteobacteria bacterium]|nr:hypothetical protein [Alphaproteobacteria bacterium]
MVRKSLDFAAIERAAMANIETIVRQALPRGKMSGHEYLALNPRRADKHIGSFKVNLRTGKWADFASGDSGGNIISLVSYACDVSYYEAAEHLAKQLGVGGVQHD